MPGIDNQHLEERALRVREHVIQMSTRGGCFVGSALSCVDVLVYLYSGFLNICEENLNDPARDYFFLSKGHAVPALYGTLAEIGLLKPERLAHHLEITDDIYWHPNRSVPGVEFHAGSLGHGLPVALGVALDCKLRGGPNKVVVLVGDGELDEGSNWEALLVASAYHLDNLVVVVDRNGLQANMATEDLIPLEPLAGKLEAFGCGVVRVDGHGFDALDRAFRRVPLAAGRPSVILAETVRGRGIPSIEQRADRWFYRCDALEAESFCSDLRATAGCCEPACQPKGNGDDHEGELE